MEYIMSDNNFTEPRTVELLREPVELYKVLKFEGLLASGGEAKAAIDAGQVEVNGQPELQRRKKLKSGDVIRFADETLVLALAEGAPTAAEQAASDAKQAADSSTESTEKNVANAVKPAKKDWRKKRTPAEIDAAAGIFRGRGKLPV